MKQTFIEQNNIKISPIYVNLFIDENEENVKVKRDVNTDSKNGIRKPKKVTDIKDIIIESDEEENGMDDLLSKYKKKQQK